MLIGEKIKSARKNLGYTQEQLANKLSVSRSTITNWETGKSVPNDSKLKEISSLFDISLENLTNEDYNSEKTTEVNTQKEDKISKTVDSSKEDVKDSKNLKSTDTIQSDSTTKTNSKKKISNYKKIKSKPFNLFCIMSGFTLLFCLLFLDGLFGNLFDYLSIIIFDQKIFIPSRDDTSLISIAIMAIVILIIFLVAIFKSYRKAKNTEKPDDYFEVTSDAIAIKKRRRNKFLKFLTGFLTPTILAIISTCFIVSNAYEKAIKEHENLNYEKGNAIFMTLYNYKDSKDRIIDLTKQIVLNADFIAKIDRETKKVKIEWTTETPKYKLDVSKWENVVNIDYGVDYDLNKGYIVYFVGVTADGEVLFSGNNKKIKAAVKNWNDIVMVSAQDDFLIGLKKDGTVVAAGSNEYGQCEVLNWENIAKIETDSIYTLGIKKNGEIVCTEDWGYIVEDKQLVGSKAYDEFTYYYDIKKIEGNEIKIHTNGRYDIYSRNHFFLPEIPDSWDINKKLVAIEVSNDGSLVCLMFSDGSSSLHNRFEKSSYSSSSDNYGSSSSSSKEYGKGGYEMPNENDDSLADYIQRVDPDLYDSMENQYNNAVNSYNSNSSGFVGSDGEYHNYVPEFGDDVNNWMAENW